MMVLLLLKLSLQLSPVAVNDAADNLSINRKQLNQHRSVFELKGVLTS